jgi:UDP-glucose 4-epimerase
MGAFTTQTYVVTGGSGFVGRSVVNLLRARHTHVTHFARSDRGLHNGEAGHVLRVADNFADISAQWPDALRPQAVIHLAARVHVMRDTSANPLDEFRKTNVIGTMRLAEAAARAGVRRFVYVSSIKAVGEVERSGPLRETDVPEPTDPYGISKLEAERALFEFGRREGLEVVAVRPPLVYGPGVGANFLSLMRAVKRSLPLPLGCADALRSLVSVDNLASAIVTCADHPAAAGEVFHVCDGEDVSVAQLIRAIASAMGKSAMLLPIPVAGLYALGAITGRRDVIQRLIAPLRLDATKLRTVTSWRPPQSLETGLARTVNWFLASQ